MNFTIDAFGKPFLAEWCSEDHRQIASRDACLVLESFPCLREADDNTLRRSAPAVLTWVWIQDADREMCYGATGLKTKPTAIIPAYRDERRASFDWQPWTPQSQALAAIIESEVYSRSGKTIPLFFDEPTGLLAVRATLESGNTVFLHLRTSEFHPVPRAALQHFQTMGHGAKLEQLEQQTQKAVAHAEALAITPEGTERRQWWEDPIPWGSAAFDDIVRVLGKGGLKPGEIHGAILFAYGKDREYCAKVAGITPRHFSRKVMKAAKATAYAAVFSRSEAERKKACDTITEKVAAQLREKIETRYDSFLEPAED